MVVELNSNFILVGVGENKNVITCFCVEYQKHSVKATPPPPPPSLPFFAQTTTDVVFRRCYCKYGDNIKTICDYVRVIQILLPAPGCSTM